MQGLLEPIRSLQGLPASVPIVDRLDTLRQTKSTVIPTCSPPTSPPPRLPFDWWQCARELQNGASSACKKNRKRKSILARKLKQSDTQARREERARLTKRKAGNGQRQKARNEAKERKTQGELDREQAIREDREQLQALKRELQERARQEREERQRQGGEVQLVSNQPWWRAAADRSH